MHSLAQYKGLPKQIYILSVARAVIAMGMMFVYPFLSLLLTKQLGYSELQASYIVVVCSVAAMVGSLAGGKLADHVGRKTVFIAAALIITCVMGLTGFLVRTRLAILLIIISYFAVNMILPTVSAMILDWSSDDNKTECFSMMYLGSNIGCALGPVMAGLLFYSHMPWIFFSMAISFFLTLLLVCFFIQDIHVPVRARAKEGPSGAAIKEENLLKILFTTPVLLIFVLCLGLLTLCYINLDFMLPLQLSELFGLDAGSKYSSLVWTINGIVVVAFTPFIVSVTKKNHQLFNIGIACLLYALGFGFYIFSESLAAFMISVVVWTSGEILISTGAGIYIADQTPETHKGRSMALYEFARGIGKLTGPLTSGLLLTRYTYGQSWLVIVCICLAVGAVVWYLYYKSRNRS